MAEQIEVEFDLDPVTMVDLMTRKNETVRQFVSLAAWVALGIVGLVLGQVGPAILLFGLAAFFGFVLTRVPKIRQNMALRLAGPTTVRFSDEGMDFRGANVAERLPWARFQRVADRPALWYFQTKAPVASFVVPKSAVPAEIREQFTDRLMDWSGSAYKFRKR